MDFTPPNEKTYTLKERYEGLSLPKVLDEQFYTNSEESIFMCEHPLKHFLVVQV